MSPDELRDVRWRELTTRLDRFERHATARLDRLEHLTRRHERQSQKDLEGIRDAIKSVLLGIQVMTEHLDEFDRTTLRPFGDGIRIPGQRH